MSAISDAKINNLSLIPLFFCIIVFPILLCMGALIFRRKRHCTHERDLLIYAYELMADFYIIFTPKKRVHNKIHGIIFSNLGNCTYQMTFLGKIYIFGVKNRLIRYLLISKYSVLCYFPDFEKNTN